MSEFNNEFVTIKSKNEKKTEEKIIDDEYKLDKAWEITDLFIKLKEYTSENAIYLLDECSAHDLIDLVFDINNSVDSYNSFIYDTE